MKSESIQISFDEWCSMGLETGMWDVITSLSLFTQYTPLRIVKTWANGPDVFLIVLGWLYDSVTIGTFKTMDDAKTTVANLVLRGASYQTESPILEF